VERRKGKAAVKRESFLEFDDLALDLFFCSEILRLTSLHYGLWADPDAEALTLDNLRVAQRRYTEALCGLIPAGTRSVLDVGCGLGDVATRLASRGLIVTAISPDKNHGRYLKRTGGDVRFVQARYQTFQSTQSYDLVLMSESQNYFQPETCFGQTARHLSASGHLLVSGMFRKPNSSPFPDFVNVVDDFIGHGARAGFEVVEDFDVTEQVLPTLRLVHGAISTYVNPSVELLQRFAHSSAPVKLRALRWLFRKQLGELRAIHRYLLAKTDPVVFEERACYRMLLFRRAALSIAA
jgi:MPBQ/MSBQ methyltransferase